MSQLTISVPDTLDIELEKRARAAGFNSREEYLLELVRADCERAELEPILESRIDGPFAPLEADWKQQVRDAAQGRG